MGKKSKGKKNSAGKQQQKVNQEGTPSGEQASVKGDVARAGGEIGPAASWAIPLLFALLAIGIGIGAYLTWHHELELYGGAEVEIAGCEESEKVDCGFINTSEWSEILGIPIALLSIPTYLVIGLLGFWGWRRKEQAPLAYAFAIGVLTVLYSLLLFYQSKFVMGKICLWCMRLYGINIASTVLLALAAGGSPIEHIRTSLRDLSAFPIPMRMSAMLFLGALVVGLIVQRGYRASLVGDDAPTLAGDAGVASVGGKGAKDPKGTPKALKFSITTEDNNAGRTLAIGPDDAWKGNPDADIAIVEFADFECGYCKRMGAELKRVHESYGDRVMIVFKHFPMDPACNPGVNNKRHRDACNAARASVCAQRQGYFWAFHDLAFKNQHKLDADSLVSYIRKAGADVGAYQSCMADPSSAQAVVESAKQGAHLDIHGTPRVYVNSKLFRSGNTAEHIARELEVLLGADTATANMNAQSLRNQTSATAPIAEDVPEMREIRYGDLHFRMDTFEAAIESGKAVSSKGKVPAYGVSWFQANEACEAAGKRMCTEREWIAVCQGAAPVDDDGNGQFADDMIEGTAYPYGDYHKPGACWDGRYRDDNARPVFTGSMPGCASSDGVYDLTGNMEEWVGDSPTTAVLLGGAFDTKDDKARCYRRNDTFGAGFSAPRDGFRCCAAP